MGHLGGPAPKLLGRGFSSRARQKIVDRLPKKTKKEDGETADREQGAKYICTVISQGNTKKGWKDLTEKRWEKRNKGHRKRRKR